MEAYLPLGNGTLPHLLELLGAGFLGGFLLQKAKTGPLPLPLAWGLQAGSLLIAMDLAGQEPAGLRMLAFIAVLFLGMKAVVTLQARAVGMGALPFLRWTAFALAWPGMEPAVFLAPRTRRKGVPEMAVQGLFFLLLGAGLAWGARTLAGAGLWPFLPIPLFFIGASLGLHFGLFTLAAAFWRRMGFDCYPLFLNPFGTRSLGEFWGKRWNIGFSQMAAAVAYRPLSGRSQGVLGLMGAFALSGILHEAAISLPVRAGFGLPTLYFLLQGILVAAERRGFPPRSGLAWALFWLLLPLPLLFHRPFLEGVVQPLIGGAP